MRRTIDIEFHPNRNIKLQHVIENGYLVEAIIYHENGGGIHSVTPYRDGLIDGTEKVYDERGRLIMEIEYSGGELHGYTYVYTDDGSLEYTQLYRYGSLIDTW